MYLLLAINGIKIVKVKANDYISDVDIEDENMYILYSYAHYITIYRMVDRCYIIFIGSQTDLSSAMASRWRMEAVQQRTSLLVHMSHRNGPNTQLCRICREKYLQCMKNIFATPAPQLKLQCFHLRVCKSWNNGKEVPR